MLIYASLVGGWGVAGVPVVGILIRMLIYASLLGGASLFRPGVAATRIP